MKDEKLSGKQRRHRSQPSNPPHTETEMKSAASQISPIPDMSSTPKRNLETYNNCDIISFLVNAYYSIWFYFQVAVWTQFLLLPVFNSYVQVFA